MIDIRRVAFNALISAQEKELGDIQTDPLGVATRAVVLINGRKVEALVVAPSCDLSAQMALEGDGEDGTFRKAGDDPVSMGVRADRYSGGSRIW